MALTAEELGNLPASEMPGKQCPRCGAELAGLFGRFVYGIAHGEGQCAACAWPCRALHFPRDSDGEKVFTGPVQYVLAYHPSVLRRER